MGLGVPPKKI
jgi:hypothetical protein